MSWIETLSQPPWERLGWALIHFVWQGGAIALLAAGAVRLAAVRRGNPRYAVYLAAFALMAACPVITLWTLEPAPASRAQPTADVPNEPRASAGGFQEAPSAPASAPVQSRLVADTAVSAPLRSRLVSSIDRTLPYLLAAWLIGAMLLSLRLTVAFAALHRLRRSAAWPDAALTGRVAELSQRLGLGSFCRVLTSTTVTEPIALGLLRPAVLIPLSMLTELPPRALEAVIAHELAHIRRHDLWVNLLQRVVEALLFFHPAVWWLSAKVRAEREIACDALAVAATGQPIDYAQALERVASNRQIAPGAPGPHHHILAAALRPARSQLMDRVRQILGITPTESRPVWWPAGLVSILLVSIIIVACASRANLASDADSEAARLVRDAWEDEAWLANAQSFFIRLEGERTMSPGKGPPRRFVWFERAKRGDQVRVVNWRGDSDGEQMIWTGTNLVAQFGAPVTLQSSYFYISEDANEKGEFVEKFAEGLWWHSPLPRWLILSLDGMEVGLSDEMGRPQDYVMRGREDYEGVNCHVVEYPGVSALRRMYIGVADRRLRAIEIRHVASADWRKVAESIAAEYGQVPELSDTRLWGAWIGQLPVESQRQAMHAFWDRVRDETWVHWDYRAGEYKEIAPGRWFPMSAQWTRYEWPQEGQPAPTWYERQSLRVVDIRVNSPLDDGLFRLEMADGARISHERGDIKFGYVYHRDMTQEQVDEAFEQRRRELGYHIQDDRWQASLAQLGKLREIDTPESRAGIIALIEEISQRVADRSEQAKTQDKPHQSAASRFNGKDSQVIAAAARTLGEWRSTEADAVLRRFIRKNHPVHKDARATAAWALGMIHEGEPDEELANLLVERMFDQNPLDPEAHIVRMHSAVALGRMKAINKLDLLRNRYDNDGLEIRAACWWAITEITGEKLPPPALYYLDKEGKLRDKLPFLAAPGAGGEAELRTQ